MYTKNTEVVRLLQFLFWSGAHSVLEIAAQFNSHIEFGSSHTLLNYREFAVQNFRRHHNQQSALTVVAFFSSDTYKQIAVQIVIIFYRRFSITCPLTQSIYVASSSYVHTSWTSAVLCCSEKKLKTYILICCQLSSSDSKYCELKLMWCEHVVNFFAAHFTNQKKQ